MRHRLAIAATATIAMVALVSSPSLVSAQGSGPSGSDRPSARTASAPVVPSGFSDTVVGHANLPTAVVWTPDGRMLVASKPGQLSVVNEEEGNDVALDISARICSEGELGLVGLAVDPRFEANHFVYLYYTDRDSGSCGPQGGPTLVNRVGRFVLGDNNVIAPASEKVIVDNIFSPKANHIAGDLEFAKDGYLYISVGDAVCSFGGEHRCGPLTRTHRHATCPTARSCASVATGSPPGRTRTSGSRGLDAAPSRAPYLRATVPARRSSPPGLRNPFRFARKPGTSTFYVNDVGLHTWEEVNRLVKGKNYGWNVREGHCVRDSTTKCGQVAPYVNPVFDYKHTKECRSITGGAFVPAGAVAGLRRRVPVRRLRLREDLAAGQGTRR